MSQIKTSKRILALIMSVLVLAFCGCEAPAGGNDTQDTSEGSGKAVILFTSDVHCGVDQGFGYAGLRSIRKRLEKKGYETILVDDGDAIQGAPIGMMSRGEDIIKLMNSMQYDAAIPGNHEFDYTADRFLELAEMADFPYISCNLKKNGELVFEPYIIKEAAGVRIAFVGVTTPETLVSSSPQNFCDEDGNYIYGFCQGDDGRELYSAVQDAVDSARAEGADRVYVLGHLGMDAAAIPWTYADVIENTSGIDVFYDGHSHDKEKVVMKDKDGKEVIRLACGTKLEAIGYSILSPEEGVTEADIWTWNNSESLPDLVGADEEIQGQIDSMMAGLEETLAEPVGTTAFDLTIYDPEEKLDDGSPVRVVRRGETNLADFCTDAIRHAAKADIGLANAGSVRVNLNKGDITYGSILEMYPFADEIVMVEATGQQILDALEWGARALPAENGGFLQVSGLTYEIDVNVPSTCTSDENGIFTGVSGERRVRNVMVNGRPIDPDATYTVAGGEYMMIEHGDGHSAFDSCEVYRTGIIDADALIRYLESTGGEVSSEYADPYGQDRITMIQ